MGKMIVSSDQQIQTIANTIQAISAGIDTVIKLFINNHTPDQFDLVAGYTEATFPGYAAQGVLGADWGAAFMNAYNNWEFDNVIKIFTSTGASADTVYGYWIETGAGAFVLAELFPAPIPVPVAGVVIGVTPTYAFGNQLP
jgi:6-phosphogluconate dehydrogenase (decarboxylating)